MEVKIVEESHDRLDLGKEYDSYNLELTNDEVIFKEYYIKTQKSKLKVSQIVQDSQNVCLDDLTHFTCKKCFHIVKKPLECQNCSGLVCTDCYQDFMKDDNRALRCPVNLNGKCSDSTEDQEFGKINKFVERHLK